MCGSVEDVFGALVGLVHCPVQLGLLGAFVVCKLAYNTQHATLQDATLQHTHRVCAVRLAWFDVWHARCNVHRTPAACSVQLCDARLSLVSYLLNNTVDACMRARVRGLLTLTSVKYCETCTIARLACVFVFYPMAWLVFLAADARLCKLLREVHRGVRLARLARPRLSRGACRSTGSVARVGARNASVPVGGGSFPFLTNHRSRYFNSTTMEFWKIFRLIIVWTMMLILHYISGDNSTGEARAALRGSRAMGPALHLRCSIYV
jgi:hypothetical protein